ncbi:MAG: hypothetical protein AAB575_03310 [Patescibacteria group bacterium]
MLNALSLMSDQNLQGLIFLSLFRNHVLSQAGLGPGGLGPSKQCAEPEINVHISSEQRILQDGTQPLPPIIVVVIKE